MATKESSKDKVLTALIQTNSVREAAKISGFGEASIYRYLQDKQFNADYRAARLRNVEAAVAGLQSVSAKAVATLERNLESGNPMAEIKAASVFLDTAFRGIELLNLAKRVEEVEINVTKQIGTVRKQTNRRF